MELIVTTHMFTYSKNLIKIGPVDSEITGSQCKKRGWD